MSAFITSYIRTDASTKTRAADSASMTGANFSSWFNASAGTFVVSGDVPLPTGVASRFIEASDGATNNILIAQSATSGALVVSAGAVVASFTGTVSTGPVKSALAYAANDFAFSFNGSAVQTDTSGALPTGVNKLQFGDSPTVSRILNGHIRSVAYYPTRLPNASLQALST